MPVYKYLAIRFLPLVENNLFWNKLSEYQKGGSAFGRALLETLPLERNSDDFVFGNEMLVQAMYCGIRIGEISCPTKYFEDASSINFFRSVTYGLGILFTELKYCLQKSVIRKYPLICP